MAVDARTTRSIAAQRGGWGRGVRFRSLGSQAGAVAVVALIIFYFAHKASWSLQASPSAPQRDRLALLDGPIVSASSRPEPGRAAFLRYSTGNFSYLPVRAVLGGE